jgi:hypothetical protein
VVLLEPGASELVTIHPPAPSCEPAYEPGPNTRVLALLVPLSVGRREKFKGNLETVLVVQVNDPWRVAHTLLVPPCGGKMTLFIMSRLWPPSMVENVLGLL